MGTGSGWFYHKAQRWLFKWTWLDWIYSFRLFSVIMEFKHKVILAFVLSVFITTVFCSAKFRISKWNMCPPKESKFLSLVKNSLEACVDDCSRRKHCFAVGYKRLYTLCELYTEFSSASTERGHCVIVNKDDIQSPDVSLHYFIYIFNMFFIIKIYNCLSFIFGLAIYHEPVMTDHAIYVVVTMTTCRKPKLIHVICK
jgi:hypothetical protein